jgi:outer membrane lipoprotein LolB
VSGYSPAIPDFRCLLLLALAGCAVQRGVDLPPMPDWDARREVLAGLGEWEFRGRVGVSAGEEGFNANLRWWQKGDLFRASLSGPLGIGTVRLEGNADTVTVTDNDGEVTQLEDADQDLYEMYGWTLPVASLRFWALGIPDPRTPAQTEFGAGGRVSRLEQRNWTVQISDYSEGGGQPMPRRLTAVDHDTRVRLVIDRWIFHR